MYSVPKIARGPFFATVSPWKWCKIVLLIINPDLWSLLYPPRLTRYNLSKKGPWQLQRWQLTLEGWGITTLSINIWTWGRPVDRSAGYGGAARGEGRGKRTGLAPTQGMDPSFPPLVKRSSYLLPPMWLARQTTSKGERQKAKGGDQQIPLCMFLHSPFYRPKWGWGTTNSNRPQGCFQGGGGKQAGGREGAMSWWGGGTPEAKYLRTDWLGSREHPNRLAVTQNLAFAPGKKAAPSA